LLIIIEILVIDRNSIEVTLNSDFKDFEDVLKKFATEINADIDIIITRNSKDYQRSKLGIINPVVFLTLIDNFSTA
jgi:CRISPR/Cas system-associated protein Csx1